MSNMKAVEDFSNVASETTHHEGLSLVSSDGPASESLKLITSRKDSHVAPVLNMDALRTLPPPTWLVERAMPSPGIVCLYGESGIGQASSPLTWLSGWQLGDLGHSIRAARFRWCIWPLRVRGVSTSGFARGRLGISCGLMTRLLGCYRPSSAASAQVGC